MCLDNSWVGPARVRGDDVNTWEGDADLFRRGAVNGHRVGNPPAGSTPPTPRRTATYPGAVPARTDDAVARLWSIR
jgi:hypothetical protein